MKDSGKLNGAEKRQQSYRGAETSDNQHSSVNKKHQPSTCIIFIYMIISHQLQYTYLYTTETQIIQVLNVFYFVFFLLT